MGEVCGCKGGGIHVQLELHGDEGPSFSLEKAVCSYGFFMTAPNLWRKREGVLERPLRLSKGQAVLTRTSHAASHLIVCVLGVQELSDSDRNCILAQVTRMLRLSEKDSSSVSSFHALHPQAKEQGFGRIFRSPSLFEDMVKSCLLCNCGWGRTLSMARALCELQAELKGPPLGWAPSEKPKETSPVSPKTPEVREIKRTWTSQKRSCKARKLLNFTDTGVINAVSLHSLHNHSSDCLSQTECQTQQEVDLLTDTDTAAPIILPCFGAFPTAEELAGLDVKFLGKRCGLGYRAKHILKLAQDICESKIDLSSFEDLEMDKEVQEEEVRKGLLQLQGFGPFTCANVLMCLGQFRSIPADTETVRHLQQVHGRSTCTVATVRNEVTEVYAPFAPFQFLAYWFELWGTYEKKFGQLSCMDPNHYGLITGRNMRHKSLLESNSLQL